MMYNSRVFPIPEKPEWFYHSGENRRRPDPRKYDYSPLQCSEHQYIGDCYEGDSCEFAHGLLETWLHPGLYTTKLCQDRSLCSKYACFLAHNAQELSPIFEKSQCAECVWLDQPSSTLFPFSPSSTGLFALQEKPFTLQRTNEAGETLVGDTMRWPQLIPDVVDLADDVISWSRRKFSNADYGSEFLNQYAKDFQFIQSSSYCAECGWPYQMLDTSELFSPTGVSVPQEAPCTPRRGNGNGEANMYNSASDMMQCPQLIPQDTGIADKVYSSCPSRKLSESTETESHPSAYYASDFLGYGK